MNDQERAAINALPPAERRIVSWLQQLAELTRHGDDKLTVDKLAIYAAMLTKELPGGAFTTDSLAECAASWGFFPPFADVRRALLRWWDEHKPKSAPQLTGPMQAEGMDQRDREWLGFWHKRRAELWAGALNGQPSREAGMANLASLIRAQSPRAWAEISRGEQQGRAA